MQTKVNVNENASEDSDASWGAPSFACVNEVYTWEGGFIPYFRFPINWHNAGKFVRVPPVLMY